MSLWDMLPREFVRYSVSCDNLFLLGISRSFLGSFQEKANLTDVAPPASMNVLLAVAVMAFPTSLDDRRSTVRIVAVSFRYGCVWHGNTSLYLYMKTLSTVLWCVLHFFFKIRFLLYKR